MKRKKKVRNIFAHLFLTVIAIVWVSPLFWIIITSFRAQADSFLNNIHLITI